MVEACTVGPVAFIQAARLEDYSPELWALTGGKGATVMGMLRYVMGDENFFKTLKAYTQQYAWKSPNTHDFRKVAETVSGQDLGYFFIQWIESSGAPEFKLAYTILRTSKRFRVMGKIAQDLDTLRMPVELKTETEGKPSQKRVEVLAGELDPKWSEVWSHINLGKIFDITGQRERAVNEYNLAIRTKDDTQGAQEEAGKYLKTPYERQKRVEQ